MLRISQRSAVSAVARQCKSTPTLPCFPVAAFHSSPAFLGRKSGSKTFEQAPRSPSKKQIRKRSKFLDSLADKRDPKLEKIRERNLERQVKHGKIGKKLEEMRGLLAESMTALLAPSSVLKDLLLGDGSQGPLAAQREELDHQPERVIALLAEKKRMRERESIVDVALSTEKPTEKQSLSVAAQGNALSAAAEMEISPQWANDALRQLLSLSPRRAAAEGERKSSPTEQYLQAKRLSSLMSDNAIAVADDLCAKLIHAATSARRYEDANKLFGRVLSENRTPSREMWEAKIRNVALSGEIDQALSLIENVKKLGLATVHMYNAVLSAMLDKRLYERMGALWIRCHSEGVPLNLASFHTMMRGLSAQGEVERVFFLLDELQHAYGLQPDRDTFVTLFDACGKSPYWVRGYEQMVEETMLRMEGLEIKSDITVYNAVISAYAAMGDALRAEFYFWEAKRKGLVPNAQSYVALLSACGKSQAVGAARYGWKGRAVPRAEEKWTPDEVAMKTVGAHRTAEILTSGMFSDVQVVKGKRVKAKLTDLLDDATEREHTLSLIHEEAFGCSAHGSEGVPQLTELTDSSSADDGEELDLESEAARDPALRRLMDEVARDLRDDQEIEIDGESGGGGGGESDEFEDEDELDEDLLLDTESERRHTRTHAHSPAHEEAFTEKTAAQREKEREWLVVADALRDYDANTFSDPFLAVTQLQGDLTQHTERDTAETQDELNRERLSQSLSLLSALDGVQSAQSVSSAGEREGEPSLALALRRELDNDWKAIEFGRVPTLDAEHYLTRMPLSTRRRINKHRAMLAMQDALQSVTVENVKEQRNLWNAFLSVSAEAVHVDDAMSIYSEMCTLSAALPPAQSLVDHRTYELLIRMCVCAKDLDKALALKAEMREKALRPTSESYGLIVRAFTHRDMIVEALKTLEEAQEMGVKIHERNLTVLRNRCTKLSVSHVALGDDPQAWVKDVKRVRRNRKESSRRVIQTLQSAAWH